MEKLTETIVRIGKKLEYIAPAIILVGTFLMGGSYISNIPSASAQDLQAELDALDELPEDDLEGFSGFEDEGGVPLESSPAQSDQNTTALSSDDEDEEDVANSAPVRELGVGDLDLQGLEQELNFNSFNDGGKLSVNQLNESPQENFGDGVQGLVTGLDFKQLADRVRLVVRTNRPVDWTRELRSQRRQVIVELRGMGFSKKILKRALDTGEFEGPVAYIQAFPAKVGDRNSVKVLFQLRSFVDPTVLRTGNDLVIDFPIVGGDTLFRSGKAGRVVVPKTYMSANDIREYSGAPINLNVKQADLGDVLKFLSVKSGKNFVLSEGVGASKKVTVGLNGVPWDQALAIILFNQGLGYQDLDNVYRVATVAELQAELDVASASQKKARGLVSLETRLLPLNYSEGKDIETNIKDFLSERGKASVDERSNTLVVTDIPEVLEKVDRYVSSIDKQTPQVRIEGRIVEATEQFTRNQGFIWGSSGNNPEVSFGSTLSEDATGGTGASTLTWLGLGGMASIDLQLRLSETNSTSRTIASPSVTVLANETANINQGIQIQTLSQDESGNTVTAFEPVTTELNVKPTVTSDGFVELEVDLKRDIQDSTTAGSIGTRSIKTKMIVESGKTAVLGGLYVLDTTKNISGLPWLQKIPIFGRLFENDIGESRRTNELLMFISPTILNRGLSQVSGASSLNEGNFSASVVEDLPEAR